MRKLRDRFVADSSQVWHGVGVDGRVGGGGRREKTNVFVRAAVFVLFRVFPRWPPSPCFPPSVCYALRVLFGAERETHKFVGVRFDRTLPNRTSPALL